MLKVGLTGGIGCGKSTAGKHFLQRGIPVIDADNIAHALVQPDKPALALIAQTFGTHLILEDGSLDRSLLRDTVFSNPELKHQLEEILHPLVYAEMQLQLDTLTSAYVILSIPLLLETNRKNFVDRILIIDCSIKQQIERVTCRDQLSRQQIESIIESQVNREQRILAADDIIDNSGFASGLAEQIKKLHNLYLSLSIKKEN
jgi:dephospho-CoA kinase